METTREGEYDASSRGHLARARARFATGTKESLFYAALELRYGIEARLHEYLDGGVDVVAIKKKRRRFNHLGHEVKKVFGSHDKPVVVAFTHPETAKKIKVEYTPVTRSLEKLGKKLGKYLHRVEPKEAENEKFWTALRTLVAEGVTGLAAATKGTLLGPPYSPEPNKIKFRFEKGALQFLGQKRGATVKINMNLMLVEKDEKNKRFTLRPV